MTFEEHLHKALDQSAMPQKQRELAAWQQTHTFALWQYNEPMTEIGKFHDGGTAYFVKWREPYTDPDHDDDDDLGWRYMYYSQPPLIPVFAKYVDGKFADELWEFHFDEEIYEYYIDGKLAEAEHLIRLVNEGKPRIGYDRSGLREHLYWYHYDEHHINVSTHHPNLCRTWEILDDQLNPHGDSPCISFADAAKVLSTFVPPAAKVPFIVERDAWIPRWLENTKSGVWEI